MANNRIYYASQQVGLKPNGDTGGFTALHGVQSISMSANFNLSQVFELGQISIYENIEDIPDVEVSMTKVLDGYPPIYVVGTKNAPAPTLAGRSAERTVFALSIFPDTNTAAVGTPSSTVQCSGMYISSISYNFPVDDNFTEDVTLVGNDRIWKNDVKILNPADSARASGISFTGAFGAGTDSPIGNGGVNRRQDFTWSYTGSATDNNSMIADPDCSILPPEIQGISSSGTNEKVSDVYGAHVTRIAVSTDLNRETINELGRRLPYYRFASFPVEVTCEVEVVSQSGDYISATENGILTTSTGSCNDVGNLRERTIRVSTCEGTRIYLGLKNKLSSVNYSGGDAGGGNVTVTYSFTNFNDFTVMHSGDPSSSGLTWWANRSTYLVN